MGMHRGAAGNRRSIPLLVLGLALFSGTREAWATLSNEHYQGGVDAYRDGRLSEAGESFRKALALEPQLPLAHYHLAKIALIEADPYKAFYALKECLALDPSYPQGEKLMRRLKPLLVEQIRKDIDLGKNAAVANNILGFLLIQQGKSADGIERQEKALQLDPDLAEAYDDLAWAYYHKRDFSMAYDMVSKAYKINPTKSSILLHYRRLFQVSRLGKVDAGDPFYDAKGSRAVSLPSMSDGRLGDDMAAVHLLSQAAPPVDDSRTASDAVPLGVLVPQASPAASASPASGSTDSPSDEALKKEDLKAKYLQALEHLKKEKSAEARTLFQEIAAVDPDYADVAGRLKELDEQADAATIFDHAMKAREQGKWAAVLVDLQHIDLPALRKVKEIDSLDNYLGEAHHHVGQHTEAVKSLSSWLKGKPNDHDLRYLLVRSLIAEKSWEAALTEFETLLDKKAGAYNAYPEIFSMGLRIYVKNYFLVVVGLTCAWFFITGGYIYAKVQRGAGKRQLRQMLNQLGNLVKSSRWPEVLALTEELEKVRLSDAEYVHVKCLQGTALLETGDSTRAKKVSIDLYQSHPQEPSVHHLRAKVMLARGEFGKEAIDEYEKLLAVDPNNQALLEALNAYYQSHAPDTEQAVKILDRLLELDPTSTEFRYQRAQRYLRADDYGEAAREAYRKVLELVPNRPDIMYGLSRGLFENGRYLEAMKIAKQAIAADMGHREVHRLLVRCYQKLEMIDEGRHEYKRLIEKNPDHPHLKECLHQLNRPVELEAEDLKPDQKEFKDLYEKGVKAYLEGRFREAVAPLTSVMEVEHLRLSAGALLVRSYLKLQEVKTALALFERMDVTRRAPDEFVLNLCYDVAEVYLRESKKDRALDLYAFICRSNVSYKDAFRKLEELEAAKKVR